MQKLTRGQAIKAITMPALAAALGAATMTAAQAKTAKAAVKYQDHPKGSEKCSGCKFFEPGKSKTAMGTCRIVTGSISPNGWCAAFTKK